MLAVSVAGVSKTFGETKALVNVTLAANAGEIHAVVGENGSGKSTLAKVISGVILPDGGSIEVLGICPTTPSEAIAAGVATIYQEILLAETLSVQENLFAGQDGFWRRRISEKKKRRVAVEILSRLAGLPVDPDALVETLPLSTKQWIVIARALIAQPKVLIFDESSAALDLESTRRLHKEMERLKADGCCILLVTHRIAELVRIADVATVLRDGVTVGRLDRHEITEDRLLELMSASAATQTSAAVDSQEFVGATAALTAHGLLLDRKGPGVDFEIRAGEIVGLTGLDGAGQTQFIRKLASIESSSEGAIVAGGDGGQPIRSLADAGAAGISYVSGDRRKEGLFPRLSILENFGIALMRQHQRSLALLDFERRDAEFQVEKSRLSIKLGRDTDAITTLSGGNQQKVLIARAFALRPKIILLNDPARGVDIGTKHDLYRHLRAFAAQGGAIVYLSSEIEEFFGFAHRVDVFFGNQIFESLTGADINEHRILTSLFGLREEVNFEQAAEAI